MTEKQTTFVLFQWLRGFDSTHHIMASGDSINFGSFWKSYCVGDKYRYYPNSFSVIALPDFNFKDQYYLLHQMESYWIDKIVNQPLLYSKIIFNESNPRGKVVEKNVPFTTKIQLPVFSPP